MGSCVSSHKDPKSVMKFRMSFGSKTDKLVIPSPIKDKPLTNGDGPIGKLDLKPQPYPPTNFRDFGSKEETFFDSQAWLDSDCDDDFMSVNGEFTPSRGNTPVHHSFATGSPRVIKPLFEYPAPGARPEQFPTERKMRLSDLFKQSLHIDNDDDEQNTSENFCETPYASGVQSSEQTPNSNFKPRREKSVRSLQCCLPSLLASRSFSEKNKMSPVHSIG